jgi:hypothetical protein
VTRMLAQTRTQSQLRFTRESCVDMISSGFLSSSITVKQRYFPEASMRKSLAANPILRTLPCPT